MKTSKTNVLRGLMRRAVVAFVVAQALAGCSSASVDEDTSDPTNGAAEEDSSVAASISGELLARVVIADDHALEFYDFGEGLLAARESLSIGQEALLDKVDRAMPLPELFAAVQPGRAIPAALVAAQARADEYERVNPRTAENLRGARDAAMRPAELESVAPVAQNPELGQRIDAERVGSEQVAAVAQAATSCSSDVLGDNWGASWFRSNYCNEGCFRNCYENSNSIHWHTSKDWFKWKSMNGDYNVPAPTRGYRICSICATDETIWYYQLQPRKMDIWTMTGGHIKGAWINSDCWRAHAAALRCD